MLVPESEPVMGVVVSREGLEQLLERVVTHTDGLNVERLQKLYSVFSQCIVRHRNSYSKVDLIQVSVTNVYRTSHCLKRCSI